MIKDWRYSDERLGVRDKVLYKLLRRFGSHNNNNGEPLYSNQSIYERAQDWTNMGKMHSEGVIDFYLENYT